MGGENVGREAVEVRVGLHPPQQQGFLPGFGKGGGIRQGEAFGEAVQVLPQQAPGHQVVEGERVRWVLDPQQAQHRIHFRVAEQERMFLEAEIAGAFEVRLDEGVSGVELRERFVRPAAVEDGVVQRFQVFARDLPVPVDDVCLGEALVAAGAFLEVGDGLLRLEGEALGTVHHAEMPEDLSGGDGAGEVGDEPRNQSFGTVLPVAELEVAHPSGLGQGEVEARNGRGVLGIAHVRAHHDPVPHFHPRHELVTHGLLPGPVRRPENEARSQGREDDEKDGSGRPLPPGGTLPDLEGAYAGDQDGAEGGSPEHAGENVVEAVIVDSVAEAPEGIGEDPRCQDGAEDGQDDKDQGGRQSLDAAPGELPDQADQNEHDGQAAAGEIDKRNQDGFENPARLVGADERAQSGAGKRQDKGDCTARERAFVAKERQQYDGGQETQGIGYESAPSADRPGKQLYRDDEERHQERSDGGVVAELRQEAAGPVGQAARDGGDAPEVRPGGFEELVLFLEMQVVRVFEGEEAEDGDAGQNRQRHAGICLRFGHRDAVHGL